MPRRYRQSVATLQEICLTIVIHHIEELQNEVKSLPPLTATCLIEQLYKQSELCYYRDCDCSYVPLPANFFFHPNLTTLRASDVKFDLGDTEIALNILHDCKELGRIELPYSNWIQVDVLLAIITDNPLLTHIDLAGCGEFTDRHLNLTSKHCPQIQYLNLETIYNITDKCVDYLPVNLWYLNVNDTAVTPNGCQTVLKRLKQLTQLEHREWYAILNLLHQEAVKPTFAIESIEIFGSGQENLDKSICDMFPKLRDIRVVFLKSMDIINSLVEIKMENLITRVDVCYAPLDTIQFVGRFCPVLNELAVSFSSGFTDENDAAINVMHALFQNLDISTHNHVPFERLRKLEITTHKGLNWPVDDFSLLLKNCKELRSLSIQGWSQLKDLDIYNFLEENPLRRLERVKFKLCNQLTVRAFIRLLNSLDCLNFICICDCKNISDFEYGILEELIDDMNWDVELHGGIC